MPTSDSITREVRQRLKIADDTVDVLEGWLSFVFELHARRVENAQWHRPGDPRKVTTAALSKMHDKAREQVAVVVARLEALGFVIDGDAVDRAIVDPDPEQAAAVLMRSAHVETHAARRAEWADEDARRAAASPVAALQRAVLHRA